MKFQKQLGYLASSILKVDLSEIAHLKGQKAHLWNLNLILILMESD